MTALSRLIVRRRLRVPAPPADTGYWTTFERVRVGANFYYSAFHGVMQKVSETRAVYNVIDGVDGMQMRPDQRVMVYDVGDVEPHPELPEGLNFWGCKIMAVCRSCDRHYEWYADPEEYTDEYSYCGGSPRCIP